ncbi:MAG: hypothetical protein PT936_06605 [Treponema sp.]|nr:hypothetical protein [Treponema sp.]
MEEMKEMDKMKEIEKMEEKKSEEITENKVSEVSKVSKVSKEQKIKDFLSKSAEVSKNAFSKATDAVQKFSDKSVLKIQIQNQKSARSKKYTELGELVSELLSKKGADIGNLSAVLPADETLKAIEQIKKVQKEILGISKDIKELEKQLEAK